MQAPGWVTGPNAAGKSTFLRMVGVNVLLAQVGAAVAAREMTWSPVRLITDVRIRDDLAHNESYFLSEVRRLRRLVLDTDTNVPMLGLIDEPFRGTNSQERTAAGIALLEHLMASNHLFLIATPRGHAGPDGRRLHQGPELPLSGAPARWGHRLRLRASPRPGRHEDGAAYPRTRRLSRAPSGTRSRPDASRTMILRFATPIPRVWGDLSVWTCGH